MARKPHITKSEAIERFCTDNPIECFTRLTCSRDAYLDEPMLREAWSAYTDTLCRNGLISEHQCDTWTHPRIYGREDV